MTKQEALDMVLKMLSDGEIEVKLSDGSGGVTNILDDVGEFSVKPTTLFGVEIPTPLTYHEIKKAYDEAPIPTSRYVWFISLHGDTGVDKMHLGMALDNFSENSVFYCNVVYAEQAVKALRNA